jgi:hypothetical protein
MIRVIIFSLILFAGVNAAEPIKIRTLSQGNFSGIQTPSELVITNGTQWAEVWTKHSAQRTPKEEPPAVDFEKETVLFVALGSKPTGGHKVEIAEVRQTGDKTEVLVKIHARPPGGFSIQALTAPYHAVAIPKVKGSVIFRSERVQAGFR